MRKNVFLLFLISLVFFVSVNAQDKKEPAKEKYNLVKEGKGVEGITVGKSTMDDVIKKFGKDYRWIVNKKYSYQMNYYKKGLAFYMCQADKKKEIFVIEMKSPYKAKTGKGIAIHKSTVEDIEKAYGKPSSGLEYKGINFYYNKVDGKKVVTEIDVTENSGIRQCKVDK